MRSLRNLLAGSPTNWGRWGDDDEIGALNHLTTEDVLRGVRAVRHGIVHTLQRPIGSIGIGEIARGWTAAQLTMHRDQRAYATGAAVPEAGGLETTDDSIDMQLHSMTHVDALAHAWYDGTTWNGQPAESTNGGLDFASIMPIAERGIIGRGVLLDIPRHRGVERLTKKDRITLSDITNCARDQRSLIEHGDVIIIRTGWLEGIMLSDVEDEPGLEFHPDLVRWFHDMKIPSLVTDTIGSEATHHSAGVDFVLHGAFLRNLGIAVTKLATLESLAADCATHNQYDFLYMAAPLKIDHASASPVNPLAVL